MSWSDDKAKPKESLQSQIQSPLTSQLVVENSQLYELIEENKRLVKEQRENWQQQQKQNSQLKELLHSTLPRFTSQIEGIREALPSELSKQIEQIYSTSQQSADYRAGLFQNSLDSQATRVQTAVEKFEAQLEATNAQNQAEAEKTAQQLEELTKKAQAHSRVKDWLMTGLLAVVFVFAILAFGSTLLDGGAFQAINEGAEKIGGTGGIVFDIGMKWVLPILVIGGAIMYAANLANQKKRGW